MSTNDPSLRTPESGARPATNRWRTVDVVVASVLGVAFGLVFWLWNTIYPTVSAPLAFFPPIGSLLGGVWVMAGVVGGLVIRKPGAAFYTELLAAVVSLLLGSVWGLAVVMSGVVQGLGAEAVFAAARYRRWSFVVAVLAGAGTGAAMGIYEAFVYYPEFAAGWKLIYIGSATVSGIVIAGIGSWFLVRALARTGVLSAFPAGREAGEH